MKREAEQKSSPLPSLMLPCPNCGDRMVFRSIEQNPSAADLEDVTHACRRCNAELIRTAYRKTSPSRAA